MVPSQPHQSTSTPKPNSITTRELLHEPAPVNGFSQSINTDQTDINCEIDYNTVVMNSTLTPAVVPYADIEQTENITEDTQLLPNKEKVCVEAVVVKELTSHGADFGLKWFHLVCFMLILGVVAPLVYIIFCLDTHEHVEDDLPPLHST